VDAPWTRATGFQWDAGNLTKSLTKHRVAVQEAEEVFAGPNVHVLHDPVHSTKERRWKAFGTTAAMRYLTVSFTVRGSLVRVISARPMNPKERATYEKKAAI